MHWNEFAAKYIIAAIVGGLCGLFIFWLKRQVHERSPRLFGGTANRCLERGVTVLLGLLLLYAIVQVLSGGLFQ